MALFVSFEGPDGSGKSTQARLLAASIRERGHVVVETREPGGTAVGEGIRKLLLDPALPRPTPLAMALLLSASRAQLLSDIILPALGRGEVVVCDRYADSTMAYQSYGLGLDSEVVQNLTVIATDGVQPDVSVYVDVPVEVGLQRVAARGELNRLDAETLQFHEKVRAGYYRIIDREPERWLVVDGSLPIETIHQQIITSITTVLEGVVTR